MKLVNKSVLQLKYKYKKCLECKYLSSNLTSLNMEVQLDLSTGTLNVLEMLDWNQVEKDLGLTMQMIQDRPVIARQLSAGLFTDLVSLDTDSFSGLFSLHAEENGEQLRLKAYTIEKPKTAGDELYVFGNRIESEVIKKALLEKTDWVGRDGRRRYGFANSNAGYTVKLEVKGKKGMYLISVHQQTNRIVGETIETVRDYFFRKDGILRGRGIFGVIFTEKQALALCEGRAVRLEGCIDAGSDPFGCFVQYDASIHQVTVCHPAWLKEALKAGLDI